MGTARSHILAILSLALAAEAMADAPAQRYPTATPIKHLVVLYLKNSSFDRYFGAYIPMPSIRTARPGSRPRQAHLRSTV